jgi:hypothetical protein
MSLVRLLRAGRSLMDLKGSAGVYRMRSKNPLPKFGSPRNPFTAPAKPETPAPAPPDSSSPPIYRLSPAELAAARLKETRRLPDLAPGDNPKPAAPRAARPPRLPRWVGYWTRRLNPLAWRRSDRQPTARPAVLRDGKSPLQGELSLDNVKVVRNDLSEADVEIVPAKPAAARRNPEPAGRADERAELAST